MDVDSIKHSLKANHFKEWDAKSSAYVPFGEYGREAAE